jgi:F-type H+-transporting ATPase subunit epsilon
MNSFKLEIVTPLGVINHGSINYMRCPGLDGLFGVMANHQQGMFAVDIGEVKITSEKLTEYLATGGGFAEIMNGKVKLLVESIESSSEINLDRAKKSLERAHERKENSNQNFDMARIDSSILRAINRLKISKR